MNVKPDFSIWWPREHRLLISLSWKVVGEFLIIFLHLVYVELRCLLLWTALILKVCLGIFCCFSNKLCTVIYSVSQKPEKRLWEKDNSCKEWLRHTSHPAEKNNACASAAEPAKICNKAAGKQEGWTSYRNKSQTLWSKDRIRDKKGRENWLTVNQTPCGTRRTQFNLSLLQFPIRKMAIGHLICLVYGRLGSEMVSYYMSAHFLAKWIPYFYEGK